MAGFRGCAGCDLKPKAGVCPHVAPHKDFTAWVRHEMLTRGITASEIGARIGRSRQTVRRWVAGEVALCERVADSLAFGLARTMMMRWQQSTGMGTGADFEDWQLLPETPELPCPLHALRDDGQIDTHNPEGLTLGRG